MDIVDSDNDWETIKKKAIATHNEYLKNCSSLFRKDGAEIRVNDDEKKYHSFMYDPDGIYSCIIFIVEYPRDTGNKIGKLEVIE